MLCLEVLSDVWSIIDLGMLLNVPKELLHQELDTYRYLPEQLRALVLSTVQVGWYAHKFRGGAKQDVDGLSEVKTDQKATEGKRWHIPTSRSAKGTQGSHVWDDSWF
jgi:hypothetical protein